MIDVTKSSFVGGWDGAVRTGRDSLAWAVKTGRSMAAIQRVGRGGDNISKMW